MAISKISGNILQDNLQRGANLAIQGNLLYVDIVNSRIGVNTSATTATLTVNGNTTIATTLNVSGNTTVGNLSTVGQVEATGNVSGNYIFGNGSQLTGIDATSIQNGTSNVRVAANSNVSVGIAGTSNVVVISTTGEYVSGVVSATGNVTGGNLITAGLVSATGNVTGGNLTTAGVVAATGNVSGGNISTAGALAVTGTANVGNLNVSGTSNLGPVGNVTITGGTNGQVLSTNGSGGLSFITIGTAGISNGNSNVSIATAGGNVTTSVNGNANILVVTGTGANITGTLGVTGNVVIGNLTVSNTTISTNLATGNITLEPTGNGIVIIDTTTGLVLPVGNTAQRPDPAETGTVRFNTGTNLVEVYNGTAWKSVAAEITNQTIYGDGSTLIFVLNKTSTAAATLVATNGILQAPNVAYTVTGNSITFAQAPEISDVIDVRFL